MPFQLQDVVPWGRSFGEYVSMFSLTEADLQGRILGCGDGPAAFNADAARRGVRAISADPLYAFSAAEIQGRIAATGRTIADETRQHADEFVWTHVPDVEALVERRMAAMRTFLDDFDAGRAEGRYITAELPQLPFGDDAFDLALCSHFLFLYSTLHSADFHLAAVSEMCRTAAEVRVFPLLELGGAPSRHLEQVTGALVNQGYTVSRVRVDYEFQRGGNEMLTVKKGD